MCFRKSAKVQICWSESSSFHAGIPVQPNAVFYFPKRLALRIILHTIGSQLRRAGILALGYGRSPSAVPWQIAQFVS
jgi:hypothetical protein